MNKFNMTAIAVAVGLIFSAGMMAQTMSKDDYQAAEAKIADKYKADKENCDSQSGKQQDICIAAAKGSKHVAKAELDARHEPSAKHDYDVVVAKAEADYAVASATCQNKSGNDQDVCVKEAKAVEARIKADAEAELKVSNANKTASKEYTETGMKEKTEMTEARQEAATDKLDANYAVAKEKCDALKDDEKDNCQDAAKAKYGK